MRKLNQMQRLFVGVIVAFYAIVVGLYLTHYVPYRRGMSVVEATPDGGTPKVPYDNPALMTDIANLSYHESQMSFLGSLLLWGTVATVIVGFAIFWRAKQAGTAGDRR